MRTGTSVDDDSIIPPDDQREEPAQTEFRARVGDFLSASSFWSPARLAEPYAWVEHVPFAYWLVDALQPSMFVELGVHSGNSYFAFCQAVHTLATECACYGIDTWAGDEHASFYPEDVFQSFQAYNAEHFSAFSSPIRSTFDAALAHFRDGSIDLLHIDGHHAYESVRHDFDLWLPKLSDRGVVLIHDTNVRERNFGVHKLWREVTRDYPHFEFMHGHGLGVLAVGRRIAAPIQQLCSLPGDVATKVRSAYARLGAQILDTCVALSREQRFAASQSQIAASAARLKEVEERLQVSTAEHDQSRSERARLAAANETVLQRAAIAEEQIAAQKSLLSEARHQVESLEESLRQARANAEIEASRARERAEGQAAELVQLRTRNSVLESNADSLQRRATVAEAQTQTATNELREARQRIDILETSIEKAPGQQDQGSQRFDRRSGKSIDAPAIRYQNRDAVDLRRRIWDIESSTCWRLTWPLRRVLMHRSRARIVFRRAAEFVLPANQARRIEAQLLTAASREVRELAFRLGQLESSTSWRLTAPIRARLPRHPQLHRALHWLARCVLGEQRFSAPVATLPDWAAESTIDLSERQPTLASGARFSIIVCIHNALDDVRICLDAVLRHSRDPYELILVDDGSAPDTCEYLKSFAATHRSKLIRHEAAAGYTVSANDGMRFASGKYLVLLNSDTAVTKNWLEAIESVFESYPRTGIVGPLSNTASWQSVPELSDGDDWASNPPPQGVAIDDIARFVAQRRPGFYRLPFINGFCLALRKKMLADIGLFDEASFPRGYGEENDLCIRARNQGWELRVADNAYVWHSQSKSYSHERRKALAAEAAVALASKHDERTDIAMPAQFCRESLAMFGVREWVRNRIEREQLIRKRKAAFSGARVGFVLPVAGEGGGANVVFQEATALKRFGIDVQFINLAAHEPGISRSYPEHADEFAYFNSEEEIRRSLANGSRFDAVVSTAFQSNFWLPMQSELGLGKRSCYYIQDFEPRFDELDRSTRAVALETYSRDPQQTLITKTNWNRDIVHAETGRVCMVVGPSVDVDTFEPMDRGASSASSLRVCAMVRPSSARRQPELTYRLLARLADQFGASVECHTFGCDASEIEDYRARYGYSVHHHGRLDRIETRNFLRAMDVFVDLSTWQAMGLTLLEAMACGLLVVGPETGGASEFIANEESGFLVNTVSADAAFHIVSGIFEGSIDLGDVRRRAVVQAHAWYPERAAVRLADAMLGATTPRT